MMGVSEDEDEIDEKNSMVFLRTSSTTELSKNKRVGLECMYPAEAFNEEYFSAGRLKGF